MMDKVQKLNSHDCKTVVRLVELKEFNCVSYLEQNIEIKKYT